MKSHWLASLSAAVVLATAHPGVAGAASPAPLVPSPAAHYPPGTHYRPLCPTADAHGRRCFGQILVDADDHIVSDATSPPGGWTPNELEAAYGLPPTGGSGTVIATYIGSHYTNAESDVAAYRSKFGLSPCTSANGCFTQITDSGGTDFSGLTDDGCSGFVGEESLDVDMLMAGCPSCKILVIEGNDHASALTTASKHGAVSMSMSWGYGASASDCDGVWVPPAGLTLFGASGDSGYTASPGAPAACGAVVAVGWTQLATDSSARGYADTIPSGWGSAGGCDGTIKKPSWEVDPGCSSRMISDVSANGDNVAAFCTSPAGSANWHVTGGSSASSPFTSAALASLGVTGGSFGPAWVYAHQKQFWDVTAGGPVQSCPSGSPSYFCNAVPGYDGPTGVGTPYGPMLLTGGGDAGTGPTCVTPGGSYSQTCAGCAAGPLGSGCVLTCATCTAINGSQNPNPTLTLPCNGTIVNNDGALQCLSTTGGDAGSAADGGTSSHDAGSGGDATVPPADGGGGHAMDGGGHAVDSGGTFASPDASTSTGSGDSPGASTSSPAGCGCAVVGDTQSPARALSIAGFLLASGWRRRSRAVRRERE